MCMGMGMWVQVGRRRWKDETSLGLDFCFCKWIIIGTVFVNRL